MLSEIPRTLPQAPPRLTSYISIVQSQNQEIDVGTIHAVI